MNRDLIGAVFLPPSPLLFSRKILRKRGLGVYRLLGVTEFDYRCSAHCQRAFLSRVKLLSALGLGVTSQRCFAPPFHFIGNSVSSEPAACPYVWRSWCGQAFHEFPASTKLNGPGRDKVSGNFRDHCAEIHIRRRPPFARTMAPPDRVTVVVYCFQNF